VVALPPLIYLGGLAAGLIAHAVDPRALFAGRAGTWVGAVLAIAAIVLALWARNAFGRAGTSVHPTEPTTAIVQSGPYRFTRNPMYLALTLLYAGIVLMVNGVWPAVMAIPLLWTMHWGVITREERYLDRKFGETYRDYRRRVRRWI
jgi:protein-S-isoprenylcysteine O-methyltransferase Ste14